jgi:hypothetical protein
MTYSSPNLFEARLVSFPSELLKLAPLRAVDAGHRIRAY